MKVQPTIALVLLTFNEIEGVRVLLPKLMSFKEWGVSEIFAVDGGSTDGTLEEYKKFQVPVLQQCSRGRGEAMRLATSSTRCDYVIFFSPDGNEDHQDIGRFSDFFSRGHDLVIASRMMKGAHNEEDGQLLPLRKWANNVFNFMANFSFRRTGNFVTDSINGFRGVKRELVAALELDAVGYTIEYQMTIRAMKKGLSIAEFPTHEGQRIGGETKAPSIPTGLRFLKLFWQEWRNRTRSSGK